MIGLVEEDKSAVLIGSESLIKVGEAGDDNDRQMRIKVGSAAEDVVPIPY